MAKFGGLGFLLFVNLPYGSSESMALSEKISSNRVSWLFVHVNDFGVLWRRICRVTNRVILLIQVRK